MTDLVSVVEPIVKGAKSILQQLLFPLYAPLPCLKSMIKIHMGLNTASNNKANR